MIRTSDELSGLKLHWWRSCDDALQKLVKICIVSLSLTLVCACNAAAQRTQQDPETAAPTGTYQSALSTAERYIISTASRPASEAGREIMRAGGSAIDAAIAAQLVLGLVEPQSSGLGGGAFIVHWDQSSGGLTTYDGRETAPALAKPDRFIRNGQAIPFDTAVQSGLSIGVPGLVRLLEHTHKKHGKLPWPDLFAPAMRLANEGFAVTPRLNFLLRWIGPAAFDAKARAYFFTPAGSPHPVGHMLVNPAYAATLKRLAAEGANGFYAGPMAEAIVTAAAKAPNFPSDMTVSDLANYAIVEREPVCITYRNYKICGMGPPSSGGIAVAQTLKLLEGFDLGHGAGAAMGGQALHMIAEAEKLAYADRGRYLADPTFVPVPSGLLDESYLVSRRARIDGSYAKTRQDPGDPPGLRQRASFGADATIERAGTSHVSVIDADGNTVSMTTTIEGAFGSGVFAEGFLLNNELTDFSFQPVDATGTAIANRVEPGKRPRSSMAPTIVFAPDGQVYAALGSPGGTRIILYVVKSLVAMLDWHYDSHAAAALINFGSQGSTFEIETSLSAVWPALAMKTYGHNVDFGLMNSGTNIVARRNGHLEGGSDPRREGAALGD